MSCALLLGGICQDVFDNGKTTIGGGVYFASHALALMGHKATVLSSGSEELLSHIAAMHSGICSPVAMPIRYRHQYVNAERRLHLLQKGSPIVLPEVLPAYTWLYANNIYNEFSIKDYTTLSKGVFSVLVPQGWARLKHKNWQKAVHARSVVVASEHDIALEDLCGVAGAWVLTRGSGDISFGMDGKQKHVAVLPAMQELDSNGAGDVFAAAIGHSLAWRPTLNVEALSEAVDFASLVAACKVSVQGPLGIAHRGLLEEKCNHLGYNLSLGKR